MMHVHFPPSANIGTLLSSFCDRQWFPQALAKLDDQRGDLIAGLHNLLSYVNRQRSDDRCDERVRRGTLNFRNAVNPDDLASLIDIGFEILMPPAKDAKTASYQIGRVLSERDVEREPRQIHTSKESHRLLPHLDLASGLAAANGISILPEETPIIFVDISPLVCGYLYGTIQKRGLKNAQVIEADINDLSFAPNHFGVIRLKNVPYYAYSIVERIDRLTSWLLPEGILSFEADPESNFERFFKPWRETFDNLLSEGWSVSCSLASEVQHFHKIVFQRPNAEVSDSQTQSKARLENFLRSSE